MNDIIFGKSAWLKAYSQRENRIITWVVLEDTNGNMIYIKNYCKWTKEFLSFCKNEGLSFKKIGLQYKSNQVMFPCCGADKLYLIRSIFGKMGGSTRQCFNIGIVNKDRVHKRIISTPELIELEEREDTIEECFEEGFLENNEKTKTKTF